MKALKCGSVSFNMAFRQRQLNLGRSTSNRWNFSKATFKDRVKSINNLAKKILVLRGESIERRETIATLGQGAR